MSFSFLRLHAFRLRLGAALVAGLTAAVGFSAVPRSAATAGSLSPEAELGRLMFFDKSLSGSGKMACASCHDPAHAYAPPNDLSVQLGGPRLTTTGVRAVPSLRYKEATPPYADMLDNPDGISTPGPGGGLMQDGSAPTLAAQARMPLLNPIEMANHGAAEVAKHLRLAAYADRVRQVFGAQALDRPDGALDIAGRALQAFQIEDPSFHPYSSRYDLYSGNKIGGTMSPAEMRGFEVYSNPNKGNCFACHYNGAGLNGSVALFTDFTYAAIGVPRNGEIPANRDPRHFDLGLCARADHAGAANAKYCGEFKTPTLRNVATRSVFFHNGKMKSLAEVIRFYNTRDTDPGKWYPTVGGKVRKYDDLPPRYRGNIDTQAPLDGRAPGSTPPMTEQEMADLEAFLDMLTDKDMVPMIRTSVSAPDGTRSETTPVAAKAAAIASAPRADPIPDLEVAAVAVRGYLATHGHLCLGKMDWPVDVSELDQRARGRDALQMPVLESLGLVHSHSATAMRVEGPHVEDESSSPVAVPVTRYELTPAGQAWMRPRDVLVAGGPQGDRTVRRDDLCVATLDLASVKAWRPVQTVPGAHVSSDAAADFVASFTYTAKAAPWGTSAEFRRVFPLLARALDGAGSMELRERFRRIDGGAWAAVGMAD
jgi:cytochrome c peroxidase